jgi:beta-phosphoglucomutase
VEQLRREDLALILDVDGVLVDTPNQQAWAVAVREILTIHGRSIDLELLPAFVYQRDIAGRSRREGAAGVLQYHGIVETERTVDRLCAAKDSVYRRLIEHGRFSVYEDALNLAIEASHEWAGIAYISASQYAKAILGRIHCHDGRSLLQLMGDGLWGADALPRSKALRTLAAVSGAPRTIVVDDAARGTDAAVDAGLVAVGLARSPAARRAFLRVGGTTRIVSDLWDSDVLVDIANDAVGRADQKQT